MLDGKKANLEQSDVERRNTIATLLADWGLGDHWRYEDFKVGWVKGEEHESFYSDNNFLWSFVFIIIKNNKNLYTR